MIKKLLVCLCLLLLPTMAFALEDDEVTPDNVLSTGQTDEYCLTYESAGSTWEWRECSLGANFGVKINDTEMTAENFGDWTCSGAEDGCTLNADVVSKVQMADSDHGDVSWTNGVATVENVHCPSCIDISSETNLTAGRSLTQSDDSIEADAELYTDTKCIWFEDPTADDDFESIWIANGFAVTITKIWCESDQTVNMDLAVDDGSVADVNGTDLVCDSTPAEDESMGGDATLADGDRLDLLVTTVSGTPTWVSICWTYTYDD